MNAQKSDAVRMQSFSHEVIHDNVKMQPCPAYAAIQDNTKLQSHLSNELICDNKEMQSYPVYATIEDTAVSNDFKVDNPLYEHFRR